MCLILSTRALFIICKHTTVCLVAVSVDFLQSLCINFYDDNEYIVEMEAQGVSVSDNSCKVCELLISCAIYSTVWKTHLV